MKSMRIFALLCGFFFLFYGQGAVFAADFSEPAIATTCGKSPGALMVKMIAEKVGIPCEQNDDLTADVLVKGNYKTLFITMGASGKGLGAAGTDIEADCKRITALINKAREMNIKIIGTQLEGIKRRTDKADDLTIDTVAPFVDLLLIKEDGNADGRFTKIADDKKIPLHSVKQPMETMPILKTLFGK